MTLPGQPQGVSWRRSEGWPRARVAGAGFLRYFAGFLGAAVLAGFPGLRGAEVKPLTGVHAHNDYEHTRPLFDALDNGFCSVEADVHLVHGRLYVAHIRLFVKEGRTLESLYLDPLRERIQQNGGRVYPGGPEFVLLVELKDDWRVSYATLRRVLEKYSDILTTYRSSTNGAPAVKETRAVRVIITGHRAKEMFAGETVRYASVDGSLAELRGSDSADLVPWVSTDWPGSFKWRGHGVFPEDEVAKLKGIVARAHEQGRRVRFWGAPDKPAFWKELVANGVDIINTDDLEGARKFFLVLKP